MKRILKGKIYDTETASQLAWFEHGTPFDSASRYFEGLYVTKKGAYFLHGYGGYLSPYAEKTGTLSWCGGETIKVMSRKQVLEWLEKSDNADVLEAHFADALEEA